MTLVAIIIAIATALSHGATALRAPDGADDYAADTSIAVIVEWTGPHCGAFDDEPCYVIVYRDMTTDVGP